MEFPFYLSFKDFEKNYYNHLEQWFEKYHNTNEIDFLKALACIYKPYVSYNPNLNKLQADPIIKVKNIYFTFQDLIGISQSQGSYLKSEQLHPKMEWKSISMIEYAQIILDKINQYLQKKQLTIKENESIHDFLNRYDILCTPDEIGYSIDYRIHQQSLPFLKAYLPELRSTADISLYRNFYFSVVRIVDFIDAQLNANQAYEQSVFTEKKSKSLLNTHFRNQNYFTICN